MSEDFQIEKEGSDMESDVPEVPKPGFVRQKVDAVSIPAIMHLDVHFAKFVECFIMMLHCTCLLVGTLFECYNNCLYRKSVCRIW